MIDAITRLFPGYVLTDAQRKQISLNTDPQQSAARLSGAVESLARCLSDKADTPFDWRLIPVEWILPLIDLSRVSEGYHWSFSYTSQKIDENLLIELGRIVERYKDRGHDIDLICAEYQRRQGRNPDHAGLVFWLDALERGNRSAVFAAMVEGLG